MQNKRQKTTKNKFFNRTTLILAIELIVIIVLAIIIFSPKPSNDDSSSVSQPIEESVVSDSVSASQAEPEEEDVIDFDELTQINSDTIGYLQIPGTIIDYPVVKGIDNVKYLSTNFNGEYDILGTVFADMANNDSLQDPLTVLYGHYDSGGSFFTQLHLYRDADYFAENPDIYLTTPSGEYKYEIIAAFENDNYSLMYEKDYYDKEQLQGFIDKMANIPDVGANLNLDGVSTSDRFLALSTCLNAADSYDKRYIVVAKLVENE